MNHKFKRCRCDEPDCLICSGETDICVVCGAQDKELPTDCPDRKMTKLEKLGVKSGITDFYYGAWLHKSDNELKEYIGYDH